MLNRFLCLIGLMLLFSSILFGQEVNISSAPIWGDTEPNLVVNPDNPDNIVVAWIKFPFIVTKTSMDGGQIWGALQTITPLNYQTMADPTMAFHNDTVYLCYVDYKILTLDT